MKDYQIILNEIKRNYTDILKENLVGIYIHGSIAFHCFNWAKSDIDFIVVVKNKLDSETKLSLLDTLETLRSISPPKGIEMSVVTASVCNPFIYPTPYELHYSQFWLPTYLHAPLSMCTNDEKFDHDLASHFTVINYCGIVLCGAPINEVFSPVKRDYYVDSLLSDIEDTKETILELPLYKILNLCRVLAYLKEGRIISKEEGSIWGLSHLDSKYAPLLEEAQIAYSSSRNMHLNKQLAVDFGNYMIAQIKTSTPSN